MGKRKKRIAVGLTTTACCMLLVLAVAFAGCGESSDEVKAETYRTGWKETMESFFEKLDADDKKAEQLSQQGDTAGVIGLVNQRIKGIQAAMLEISGMEPTTEYMRLNAVTLYFMLSLIDQLEAQNELNKAMVSGQPMTDLTVKVENMAKRVQAVGNELSVEQLSVGIVLEDTGVKEPSPQDETVPKANESKSPEKTEEENGDTAPAGD